MKIAKMARRRRCLHQNGLSVEFQAKRSEEWKKVPLILDTFPVVTVHFFHFLNADFIISAVLKFCSRFPHRNTNKQNMSTYLRKLSGLHEILALGKNINDEIMKYYYFKKK